LLVIIWFYALLSCPPYLPYSLYAPFPATTTTCLFSFCSTYGDTPNDPLTWDAARIYGCYCDKEYEGYDCSLYMCPHGDDPYSTNQLDEKQVISCQDADTQGNIILTFRQQSTDIIAPSATVAEIKAALETLSTVSEVAVETYVTGATDQLCTSAGNQFVVTFLTEHGDLPMLQVFTEDIDTFAVAELYMGEKETLECSGRGLCDHGTGECQCFTGFGSSDGKGSQGTLRDCGYVEPLQTHVEV
jgi:hypothetical protein